MSAPKPSTRAVGLRALGAGLLCLGVALALHLSGFLAPALVILGVLGTGLGATLAVWGDGYQQLDRQQKLLAAGVSVMALALLAAVVGHALGAG